MMTVIPAIPSHSQAEPAPAKAGAGIQGIRLRAARSQTGIQIRTHWVSAFAGTTNRISP
jgi:hypothetical protein